MNSTFLMLEFHAPNQSLALNKDTDWNHVIMLGFKDSNWYIVHNMLAITKCHFKSLSRLIGYYQWRLFNGQWKNVFQTLIQNATEIRITILMNKWWNISHWSLDAIYLGVTLKLIGSIIVQRKRIIITTLGN